MNPLNNFVGLLGYLEVLYLDALVSTKKSYEDFEIVDIQFVVSKFGTQRFDFIFAVCIRLFEKFSQSKKSLYSATY